MFLRARNRAQKQNIPFNLEESDIVIPKFCPVLGIELKIAPGKAQDCSPSIDKIVPALGYVKGNICIISWRANLLKNNATLDELERVTDYVRSYSPMRLAV
jgi:hypothetical protein